MQKARKIMLKERIDDYSERAEGDTARLRTVSLTYAVGSIIEMEELLVLLDPVLLPRFVLELLLEAEVERELEGARSAFLIVFVIVLTMVDAKGRLNVSLKLFSC
jgi:hypothetical protein